MWESDHVDPNNPIPLYFQVFSVISERIESGELRPDQPLPSERALVDIFGVSRITIVKAIGELEKRGLIVRLHGKGNFVRCAPTQPTDDPTSARSPTWIGLIYPEHGHPFQSSILVGVAQSVAQANAHLQVISPVMGNDRAILEDLIHRGLQGLLIYPRPGNRDAALVRSVADHGTPVVLLDRVLTGLELDAVLFDDKRAAHLLTKRLIDQGCHRVAVVPFLEANTSSIQNRLGGFREALAEADLPYDDSLIWLDLFPPDAPHGSLSGVFEQFRTSLISAILRDRPDSLFALNADAARGIVQALMIMRSGIGPGPELDYLANLKITAISHEDSQVYAPYHVAIARQRGEDLGKMAAELLLERISLDKPTPPVRKEVEMSLILPD